jgi:ubiquinone/menaquinone biosynthesis C-methylase UbiE
MKNNWKAYWSSTDNAFLEKIIQRYKSKKGYEKLLNAAPDIKSNSVILEVGAGKAWLSRILRTKGCKTTAIDNEPGIVEANKHTVDKYLVEDMYNLSFEDDSFDLVISCGLIEHFTLENTKKIVQEMARVGKSVVAWYPTCGPEWKIFWYLRNIIGGNVVTETHNHSLRDITEIFSKAGLEVTKSATIFLGGIFRYRLVYGRK